MNTKKLLFVYLLFVSFVSFSQTIELDGQRGYGNRQVWDDKNYKTCADWQKAVDNGTYNAPSGFKDIQCTDKSISGGGVSLSGTSSIKTPIRKMGRNITKSDAKIVNISDSEINDRIDILQRVLVCGEMRGKNRCFVFSNYANCAAFDADVKNGGYNPAEGFKGGYTCESIPGGGVLITLTNEQDGKEINDGQIKKN